MRSPMSGRRVCGPPAELRDAHLYYRLITSAIACLAVAGERFFDLRRVCFRFDGATGHGSMLVENFIAAMASGAVLRFGDFIRSLRPGARAVFLSDRDGRRMEDRARLRLQSRCFPT